MLLTLAAAACGGELRIDVDAGDASFDVNAHWGECCDQQHGGLGSGSSCLDAGYTFIDSGVPGTGSFIGAMQCLPNQYCGVRLSDPQLASCCGHMLPVPENPPRSDEIDQDCPPFPGFVDRHWGECCYTHDNGTNPFIDAAASGGIPGACAPNVASPGIQCPSNQYCGQDFTAAQTVIRCCGDRTEELGTPGSSGLDPSCPTAPIVP